MSQLVNLVDLITPGEPINATFILPVDAWINYNNAEIIATRKAGCVLTYNNKRYLLIYNKTESNLKVTIRSPVIAVIISFLRKNE